MDKRQIVVINNLFEGGNLLIETERGSRTTIWENEVITKEYLNERAEKYGYDIDDCEVVGLEGNRKGDYRVVSGDWL